METVRIDLHLVLLQNDQRRIEVSNGKKSKWMSSIRNEFFTESKEIYCGIPQINGFVLSAFTNANVSKIDLSFV